MLTPEGHKHCIEHSAWVVKEVSKLCIAAHLAQVPEVAPHVDITEWAHVELFFATAHFCS